MNTRTQLFFSQFRAYESIKARLRREKFRLRSKLFTMRYGLAEAKTDYKSFQGLLSLTQTPFFLALIFGTFLQFTDLYLVDLYRKFGIKIPADGDYATFLATIAGIGGVFIGLYYAAISTVSSTIYSSVPSNLKDLLTQERYGNVYMRFLSFLTFLCVVLLLFRLSGQPRAYLAVVFIAVCSGIGIFSFVTLGKRAFDLFDPTQLSPHVIRDLNRWLAHVKVGAFRWNDPLFQGHAQKQASKSIDTLRILATTAKKEAHLSGESYVKLSKQIVFFLYKYEISKRNIPTSSNWYEQTLEFKDWYRTEDSAVSLAHQSGTTLQPETAHNHQWIEEQLIPIVLDCITVNYNENRFKEVLSILGHIESYIQLLAQSNEIDRAFDFAGKLATHITENLQGIPGTTPTHAEQIELLAILDTISRIPITIAIGHREALQKTLLREHQKSISSIEWKSEKDIYSHNFPLYCLDQLEWLRGKLEFEFRSEDRYISPSWYLQEILRLSESRRFTENVKSLVNRGVEFYERNITDLRSKNRHWSLSAFLSREREYWSKLDFQKNDWNDSWKSLIENNRIEGLAWPVIDLEELGQRGKTRETNSLKAMVDESVRLALLPRPKDFPDYPGQFLHIAGECTFLSMIENDHQLFSEIFDHYLAGCLLKFDAMRAEISGTDWRAQQQIKIASAPILDLMDISGYAKLFSDIHDQEIFWDRVVDSWSKYISGNPTTPILEILAAALGITESAFELSHRSILRTQWQQMVQYKLSEIPTHEVDYGGMISATHTSVDHESTLVRVYADGRHYSPYDGIDAFIEFFVRAQGNGSDLDFGRRRSRDLREALEREKGRYQEDNQE
ncbi:hypothetical protein E4634_00090 [Mangrovimicrobium sediminis]|uniref:Uncharacterized protein n=1 Tax=Mangrovimicrobium sediminis TaxID=2562682 RepID=A0A4Z0M8F0_9GAMM|nr:hypothetical protein [Haliea sp. SAOS-164]TGD75992.1 hypothetical protein E4634_00090 [Haliea sp. SAOS-164]